MMVIMMVMVMVMVMVCAGSDLLSLTKAQCLKRSPEWGDMIYNALHLNPAACEGIFELHHHHL